MKYRHSFHAGNFADVHKHVALLALLSAMQRKDKGFVYLDTHAGAGRYDLASPETHHGAEAKHGVSALLNATTEFETEEL
jgi:23S rRNA (adenine2030-N6)-methyltransferase